MTGQGERRHKEHIRIRVVRIDRERPASQFDRLIIALQPEIGPRLVAVIIGERRIGRARPNRLVESFNAFVESPERQVVDAQAAIGIGAGRVQRERALEFGDGFLGASLVLKDPALRTVSPGETWIKGERLGR